MLDFTIEIKNRHGEPMRTPQSFTVKSADDWTRLGSGLARIVRSGYIAEAAEIQISGRLNLEPYYEATITDPNERKELGLEPLTADEMKQDPNDVYFGWTSIYNDKLHTVSEHHPESYLSGDFDFVI